MKRLVFVVLVFSIWSISGHGQETEFMPEIGLTTIAQTNQGNSYITFPADIGNIEPLWFEANLKPNFYIRQSKNSRLVGVLTPQIIIRMYQEESFPVRTPSYMPQITMYYSLYQKVSSRSLSLFGRITHHSNGQEQPFYLDNGDINLKSGNFSTNFLEVGLLATNINHYYNAYQFFKTSLEIHPKDLMQEELLGIFSAYRWNSAFSIFKLAPTNTHEKAGRPTISLKGEITWMLDRYNNLAALSGERFNLSFTFYYHPKFFEDIGLFFQYYHGSDYYNIYFNHRIDMLRIGLMTEKLRF